MLAPSSIAAGDIYWLQKERDLPENIQRSLAGVNQGVFGHPIVVVAVSKSGQSARCCTITSLGGQSFQSYHASNNRAIYRQNHIPIAPSPHHPDTGIQLHTATGINKFDKASYVKIGSANMFSLPRLALDCGWSVGENHRLAPSSLDVLRLEMKNQGCGVYDHQVEEMVVSTTPSSRSSSPGWESGSGSVMARRNSGGRYRRWSDSANQEILRKTSWRRGSDSSSSVASDSNNDGDSDSSSSSSSSNNNKNTTTTIAAQPNATDAKDDCAIIGNSQPSPRLMKRSSTPIMPTFTPLSPLCRMTCKC